MLGPVFRRRRARAFVAQANVARDRRNWKQAAELYQSALQLIPQNADIWVQLGHMQKEGGDRDSAARSYAEAIRLAPGKADTHLQVGHLQKLQGDIDAAVASYAQALTLDHQSRDAAEELRRLGREDRVAQILAGPKVEAPRPTRPVTETDRISEISGRLDRVASQIPAFLEHVSATKALSFELARLKSVVSDNQAAKTGGLNDRIETLEGRLDVVADQIAMFLEHTSATKAMSFELAQIREALNERADRTVAIEHELAELKARIEPSVAATPQITEALQQQSVALAELETRSNQQLSAFAVALARHGDVVGQFDARLQDVAAKALDPEALRQINERLDQRPTHEDMGRAINGLRREIEERLQSEIVSASADNQTRDERLGRLQTWLEDYIRNSDGTLRYLLGRVEFVRQELLLEYRYAPKGSPTSNGAATTPEILNAAKIEAAKREGRLALNLGCGHIPEPDCINVDQRELPGVDVVADADALPFEPGSLDEIRSSHMLEHFPEQALVRGLLPYWRGLLKPGGRFQAVVPDGETMLAEHAAGRYPFSDLREVLYGGQDYTGDFHFNLLTPDSLKALLEQAGFEAVTLIEKGRRNGACYEFEMEARA